MTTNRKGYVHPEKGNHLYTGTFHLFSEMFFLTLHHYKTNLVYISLKHPLKEPFIAAF